MRKNATDFCPKRLHQKNSGTGEQDLGTQKSQVSSSVYTNQCTEPNLSNMWSKLFSSAIDWASPRKCVSSCRSFGQMQQNPTTVQFAFEILYDSELVNAKVFGVLLTGRSPENFLKNAKKCKNAKKKYKKIQKYKKLRKNAKKMRTA